VVPELSSDDLDGVQDGGMAMQAFSEAIHPDTAPERENQLAQQLRAYCQLDTYAMVRLWQVFAGRGAWCVLGVGLATQAEPPDKPNPQQTSSSKKFRCDWR